MQIEKARSIQRERYATEHIELNGQMDEQQTERYGKSDQNGEALLELAYAKMNLNPRTILKVRKLARTIADLEASEIIKEEHVAEALQYREKIYGR